MLANTSAYPESADYPNDGIGSDHDSLGIFQMRPASGWGTVAELMIPEYQARAFFGGPLGPNGGSPRGLLDISGWQQMDPGEAAQAVEVSAYPDRYQNYQPVAEAIIAALTRAQSGHVPALSVPETSRVVFPLPAGTYTIFRNFGWRIDPFSGSPEFHRGSDLAAPLGTPILAIADGVVSYAGQRSPHGGQIIIEHTVGGERVASYYHHMYDHGIRVAMGESVAAGQQIGDVGSAGRSTGPHLHIEIHPGGADEPAIDALQWLSEHSAVSTAGGDRATTRCVSERAARDGHLPRLQCRRWC
ncbi:MAG: M23 family metallopeptidase, partial [Mycetocola sp.]